MAETLQNLALGFSVALSPTVLLYAFVGCVIGTLVGVLPGEVIATTGSHVLKSEILKSKLGAGCTCE